MAGCATKTVPVTMKFPEAPSLFFEPCSNLSKIKEDAKLSEVATNVSENYMAYHRCSDKNDAWIEWYKEQKQIFESVK
jgi:hypothetical protein